jgi:hypothetical protein
LSREGERRRLRIEDLAARFFEPLLCGGTVEVGVPVGPGLLDDWELLEHVDDKRFEATREAAVRQALALAPAGAVPWPDRGAFALALALYDLLVLTDGAFGRGALAGAARREVTGWVQRLIEEAGTVTTRGQALARHAVVVRVFAIRRPETQVRTWAARYRYAGRPVPGRIVALPRLRGVRTDTVERPLPELLRSDEETRTDDAAGGRRRGGRKRRRRPSLSPPFQGLLRASPITAVLHPEDAAAPLFEGELRRVLADDRLRAGIARGLAVAPRPRLQALGSHLGDLPAIPPAERWPVLALLHELVACGAFAGSDGEGDDDLNQPSLAEASDGDHPDLDAGQLLEAVLGLLATDGLALLPEPLRPLAPVDGRRLRRRGTLLLDRTPAPIVDRARRLLESR